MRPQIKDMPGVKHVLPVGDSAVSVVAETWWQAKSALDALPIVWDEGEHAKVSSESIAAWLKEGLDAPTAVVGNQNGDVKAAIANAARTIEAVYSYPYQNHATMETMNATALYTPDKCEVWTPTQNGEAALAATAEASGLPLAKCEAYKIDLGGGFGRRGAVHDWVRQVVAIAKQMPGTPVKLIWSREEDMTAWPLPPDHPVQADRRARQGRQPDRPAYAHFRPVDRRGHLSRRTSRTGATRSFSRASTRRDRKPRSAMAFPTC